MGGKGWTGHTFQPCTAVGLFHILIQRCGDLLSRKGKDLLRLCSLITRFCQSYICPKQSRGIKLNSGAGEAGGPGGGAGRQAAPPHLGLPHYHGKAWWRGQPQQLFCVQVEFVQVVSCLSEGLVGQRPRWTNLLRL